MTCQELHCYLENPLRVEIYMYRESLPAAVSEHLSQCGDCARLFEEQKALGIRLQMAREAAPEVPQELTAKVLESYRRQMQGPEIIHAGHGWKVSRWLGWSAAAAVVLAVISILVLSHRHEPIMVKKIGLPETKVPSVTQQEAVALPKEVPGTATRSVPVERVRKAATVTHRSPLPPGFASLMYCDEMSCTGQMEVIRVELPPPATQTAGPAAAPVMAEVLVGTDGIARGIRIVQ